ncbi:hypothetical protein H012_gp657 [Acanthamoeba polyphaga moumouvirus]|uniref:Uncharacterized protein n=1 Tax=Acanthamoeba polyphaga moumouvirus TaxID=1269028 RepID=L7RCQ5_9VIRU|nr:hypothetical protein H012_gp657 [Acanthamoeba polyphaga moumouvirus]AGC01808.1 hypothetical protein Moumou_00264 [Acanthamoeba polyphaga moumouvirus]AQN68157.1 hypothetical protein [Saudi moumouvirus]
MNIGSQSLSVDKMYNILTSIKSVECNSPKNRKKLYKILKTQNIKFKKEVIGYTSGKKSLCRWSGRRMGWDFKRITKWIISGRMNKTEVINNFDNFILDKNYNRDRNLELIEQIFSKELSFQEIYNILIINWSFMIKDKWTPFDNCYIYKTIVRIELI